MVHCRRRKDSRNIESKTVTAETTTRGTGDADVLFLFNIREEIMGKGNISSAAASIAGRHPVYPDLFSR